MDMKRTQEDIKKELEDISPFLSKLRKEPAGFSIPDGYFQQLTAEIMEKAGASSEMIPTTTIWYKRLPNVLSAFFNSVYRPWVAISAFLIVVTLTWFFIQKDSNDSNLAFQNSDLTYSDLTQYVHENIDEFDTEMLIKALSKEEDISLLPYLQLSNKETDEVFEELIDEIDIQDLEDLF